MTILGSDHENHTDSPINLPDAGARAAERIRSRHAALTKAARRVHLFITLLLLAAIACLAGYANYLWNNKVVGRNVDERPCHVTVGKYEVSGKRVYSYPYFEILGFRFLDTSKVDEQTQIDVRGTGFTVVGIKNDASWKAYPIGMGERGIQLLERADSYVFFYDEKSVGAISYESLCK